MSGWGHRAHFHVGTWSRRVDKQTQGQLSVKPPNCHDKGEGERVDHPPFPSSLHPHTFFPLNSSPNQPSILLPHTLLQAQLTHLPKMSRQTCTKTSSHTGPHSWTSTQTPPRLLSIRPKSVMQSQTMSKRRGGRRKRNEKSVTLSSANPSVFHREVIKHRATRK